VLLEEDRAEGNETGHQLENAEIGQVYIPIGIVEPDNKNADW
jgi:hypothetical protein